MGYVGSLNWVLYLHPCLRLCPSLLVVIVHLDHDLICVPCRRRGHLDDLYPYPFYHRPLVYPYPSYPRPLVYPFDHLDESLF